MGKTPEMARNGAQNKLPYTDPRRHQMLRLPAKTDADQHTVPRRSQKRNNSHRTKRAHLSLFLSFPFLFPFPILVLPIPSAGKCRVINPEVCSETSFEDMVKVSSQTPFNLFVNLLGLL